MPNIQEASWSGQFFCGQNKAQRGTSECCFKEKQVLLAWEKGFKAQHPEQSLNAALREGGKKWMLVWSKGSMVVVE